MRQMGEIVITSPLQGTFPGKHQGERRNGEIKRNGTISWEGMLASAHSKQADGILFSFVIPV